MKNQIWEILILTLKLIFIGGVIFLGLKISIQGIRDRQRRDNIKCIENNLYIRKNREFINQNKKCHIIDETIYIYENGNLKEYE